jgi:hypothetical protein
MNGEARSTATFIVRASRDRRGVLGGVVERVRTGAKERFRGAETLGRVIEDMLRVPTPRRNHAR